MSKEYTKNYYQKNKDKIKEYYQKNKETLQAKYEINIEEKKRKSKEHYQKNKSIIQAKAKIRYKVNIDKRREYYRINKELITKKWKESYESNKVKYAEKRKQYIEANKKHILDYAAKYSAANRKSINAKRNLRRASDPNYKLACALRSRVSHALRAQKVSKTNRSFELLGCSIEEAKQHIEQQFTEGMSWENYALDTWHIDHIIPVNTFDLTKDEEQKKCFHYTNLRPLPAKENLSRPDDGSDIDRKSI